MILELVFAVCAQVAGVEQCDDGVRESWVDPTSIELAACAELAETNRRRGLLVRCELRPDPAAQTAARPVPRPVAVRF
ncbi:hypothetical protein D9M68_887580 [compost metagenome]